jgi:dihydrodipicolinate synthase/N-acetylneuraminate lyase
VLCDGGVGDEGGEKAWEDGLFLCAATLLDRLGVKGTHSSSIAPNLGAGGVCTRRERGEGVRSAMEQVDGYVVVIVTSTFVMSVALAN